MDDSIGVYVCIHCGGNPFEYVRVGSDLVEVAVSCCSAAIDQYYFGLVELDSSSNGGALKLGGPTDG